MTLAEVERSQRESVTSQHGKFGEKRISGLLCGLWYAKQLYFHFAVTLRKKLLLF